MFKQVLNFIWKYLKDWKNLLSHAIVGFLILAIGLMLPVAPIYRIIILLIVIGLNIMRMKFAKKKTELKE